FYSTRVDIVVDADGRPIQVGNPPTFQTQDNNAIAVRAHGLQTGDAVVYRSTGGALGGLAQNTTYWVIRLDDNRILLADSACHALGTCDDGGGGLIPVTNLALSPDLSADGVKVVHQLFAPGQQPIAGLRNGGTYRVCDRTATSFGLELASILGICIRVDLAANGSVGTSRFVPAVVDIAAAPGAGGKLVVDLTSAGTGTQRLQVGSMSPALPSGIYTEARVSGEGVGFIQVGETRPHATVDANLELTVGDGARIAGGAGVGIHTLNTAAGLSDGTSDGLGFISITHARAEVSAKATTTVAVRGGTDISSRAGSVVIDPLTLASGNAYAYSSGGGFGHGTESQTRGDLATVSHLSLDGRITAWNDVTAASSTAMQGELKSGASGGSFAGSSTAGDDCGDCHLVTTNDATLTVGGQAHLEADNVSLTAQMISTRLLDENRSSGDGAFEDSDAASATSLDSNVHVHLFSGAKIVGHQTVTIIAQHDDVQVRAHARATCGCFGGDSDADSFVRYAATSSVTGEAGVRIRTAALLVRALHTAIVVDSAASTGGGFIDFGGSDNNADNRPIRWIAWDADVVLHAPDPTLVVDASGRIVKKYAVTVRDGNGIVYVLGQVIPAGQTIIIDPIENNGGGTATYDINPIAGVAEIGHLTGTLGTLQVQNTFDTVRLYNSSSRPMRVNGISVANLDDVGATVFIKVDDSAPFRFSIGKPIFTPTFVDIANWDGPGTPDLTLNGYIDNPIGTTSIINDHGDILATATGSIRTNIALLDAHRGTIGTVFTLFGLTFRAPIDITLVQSDYLVDDVDPTRAVVLVADARDDVVLDVTYSARMPLGSPYASTAFLPQLGPIHAGRDIDIVVHDSLTGSDAPAFVSYLVDVVVTDPPSSTPIPPSGQYHTYFHPDPGPWGGFTDPVLVAWGTNDAVAPVTTYTWLDLSAGDDIQVIHTETGTDVRFRAFTDVDATLFAMRFPAQQYSTTNGDGEITLSTNGWIYDLEVRGDLRVGTITSTLDDVTLETKEDTSSILDTGLIDDGSFRVGGRHITLLAGAASGRIGGIGATPDFLEIRSSLSARGWVRAVAAQNVLLDQTAGTMYVFSVRSLTGDVSLRTRAGGILSDENTGATRVVGDDIDLIAVGGTIGVDSPDRSADLVIDTAP
ncbi:MAG: hypothetical protein ABW004_07350, partial [Aeromicrobium sp.]